VVNLRTIELRCDGFVRRRICSADCFGLGHHLHAGRLQMHAITAVLPAPISTRPLHEPGRLCCAGEQVPQIVCKPVDANLDQDRPLVTALRMMSEPQPWVSAQQRFVTLACGIVYLRALLAETLVVRLARPRRYRRLRLEVMAGPPVRILIAKSHPARDDCRPLEKPLNHQPRYDLGDGRSHASIFSTGKELGIGW